MRFFVLAFLLLNATAVSAQTIRQNNTRQKYKSVPQRMPVKTLKGDSSSASKMPVIKPDTAVKEKMPVVKPPANIQAK